ncbi:right-handed parallel beta-helix repeat-containing protein [Paenibacillus sp. YYML68]|uniref:right-handed parallel beta-helix repeat-containing protein n=1 Tax=Paenibacillus sp. YYML68 TaxID=2909250 RepID=UPI002492C96B|nr:right-handed parallel beta-helix repeat-containing protein [Paenibacillus sp. YYML68]
MTTHSTNSDKPRWSRRKLLAAMGTAAVGFALGAERGAGAAQASAASAAGAGLGTGSTAPWFNVKDYGAKGNGFPHEDDAQAIQTAIFAAGRGRFGGTVYIPAGKYTLGSSLVLMSNVRLLGEGAGVTTLKLGRIGIPVVHGNQVKHAAVEALSFEGLGTLSTDSSQLTERGVELKDSEHTHVRGCLFEMIAGGVWLKDCRHVSVTDSTFSTLFTSDNPYHGHGVYMEGGEQLEVRGNRFRKLEKACIYAAAGCSYSTIAGNEAELCNDTLVTVSSPLKRCAYLRIEGNTVRASGLGKGESSCKHGILVRYYCTDSVVAGNAVSRAAAAAIRLEGDAAAETERLAGNVIDGNKLDDSPIGIELVNSDANRVSGNDVRRIGVGIELTTSGEKGGSMTRDNVVTGNTLFRCTEAGIRVATARCADNAVFGNGGAGNGEAIVDKGKGTVRSGF